MSVKKQIASLFADEPIGQEIVVKGWVKTFRNNQFISLNDGSCQKSLQIVIDRDNTNEELLRKINPGAAIIVHGKVENSQGAGQSIEIAADSVEVVGESNPEHYPLQPKRHSLEFLREIAHLRPRTNTFSAIFRIRHFAAKAIHDFFNDNGFFYLNSPILTASDAEGAGEMFRVSVLDAKNPPKTEAGDVDFSQDFFGKETHLTVSGQLQAELFALGMGNVYTFGPTFRAENSNTSRHLAEFWMVEPEMAFADINDNMDTAEAMLKYVIKAILKNCPDDVAFLENRLIQEDKQKPQVERAPMNLIEKLNSCIAEDFVRISYTEAFNILRNCKPNKKKKFKYLIEEWGADLQSEHERYLVEKHFKKPVILFDYPKDIKAFYMRLNEDNKTVAAMDILFPGIGEIVGGSQREERLDILIDRMEEMDIPQDEMYWYTDIRKYGSCKHAGFGLGFERLVLFLTGMSNIRDVIAFPRFPGHISF